jgi:hypothetical protein
MSSRARHLLAAAALLACPGALAQPFVDGPKLVWPAGSHGQPGFWSIGAAQQGFSVAASSDGGTALVGARYNDSSVGAAWIFAKSGGVWSPQGAFLGTSGAELGQSVSLSSDGSTAIAAAPGNGGSVSVYTRSGSVWSSPQTLTGAGTWGSVNVLYVAISGDGNTILVGTPGLNAAWAFTRGGGTFTYQNELPPTVCSNPSGACQGSSVALSADGNTALVGGPGDNNGIGAAWIFTRSGSTWTQQGNKLVGTGNSGASGQGSSVALSADGNTALVGGPGDNTGFGAVWVFTRSGSTWTQQGSKLVGTGGTRPTYEDQGYSVALSADGNTAVLGAPGEDNGGAAWAFARKTGVWTQIGNKLVGTGVDGPAQERGFSVALSGDGRTALVGGPYDKAQVGAVWVFPRMCLVGGDVDGNGIADVSDVFYLINFLFAGGPAPVCP